MYEDLVVTFHVEMVKAGMVESCWVQVGSRSICHVDVQDNADLLQGRIRNQHQLEFLIFLPFATLTEI